MGGLFVATFLTLLFLPALYALWFRNHLDERGAGASSANEPGPHEARETERHPVQRVAAE
jgi:hypothetical protein